MTSYLLKKFHWSEVLVCYKEAEKEHINFLRLGCICVCTHEAFPPLHPYPHLASCWLAGLVFAFRFLSHRWIWGSVFGFLLRFLYGLSSKKLALIRWLNAYGILTIDFHEGIKYFVCYFPQMFCVCLNRAFSLIIPSWLPLTHHIKSKHTSDFSGILLSNHLLLIYLHSLYSFYTSFVNQLGQLMPPLDSHFCRPGYI